MANIKVSELTEATEFNDYDYTMIVQSNQNKKIKKENMFDKDVYSTSETKTNKIWIDGKPIYRKTLYISSLPNATTDYYDTTVTNLSEFIYLYGRASGGLIINGVRPDSAVLQIGAWYDEVQDKIRISTGIDRSNISAYIIILYTKTTD